MGRVDSCVSLLLVAVMNHDGYSTLDVHVGSAGSPIFPRLRRGIQ
jgi:hypothetical protein